IGERLPMPLLLTGVEKAAASLAPAGGDDAAPGVMTTDTVPKTAVVGAAGCGAALRAATARTFDRVDSDGCMSTNDTVLLLANGASCVTPEPAGFAAA